jgi:enoyl-CoA hydratase/carnithine racemase
MTDQVLYGVADGVALITLNRPDRLNAWTPDMTEGYQQALDRATVDTSVRAVVLTGAGRGFCAGADMTLLQDLSAGGDRVSTPGRSSPQLEPAVPKPVIAAVNGPCVGLGLVRALFCDIRFAVRGATLTTAFARRGLVAEHGVAWLLPRLVGLSTSLDLLLSGRTVLAEEAAGLGLVDRLVDDDVLGAAMDYARTIATSCSPASMRDMKHQLWGDLTAGLEESVERAEALMRDSFSRPDLAEGVASYLERREPRFPPLAAPGTLS